MINTLQPVNFALKRSSSFVKPHSANSPTLTSIQAKSTRRPKTITMWLRFSPSSEGWHVGWSEAKPTLKRQSLTENRKQREGMKALLARSQARTSEQCDRKGPITRYEPPPPGNNDDDSVANQPVGCLSGGAASSEAQQPPQHSLHHMASAGNVVVAAVTTPISKRRGIGGTEIANADKVANALLTSHSDAQANHVCGAVRRLGRLGSRPADPPTALTPPHLPSLMRLCPHADAVREGEGAVCAVRRLRARVLLRPVVPQHGQSGRLGRAIAGHHGLVNLHLQAWGDSYEATQHLISQRDGVTLQPCRDKTDRFAPRLSLQVPAGALAVAQAAVQVRAGCQAPR